MIGPARRTTPYDVAQLCFINLDSRKDRLEHMTRQLKPCPWPCTRIPAVRLTQSPGELGIPVIPSLAGHWHFAGIWLSHRAALEQARDSSRDGVFILLEDDVKIAPRFWTERLRLHADLPKDWEIVLLSPRHRRPKNHPGTTAAQAEKKWIRDPFNGTPVHLRAVRRDYVTAGAHFVIFRDVGTVTRVLERMAACPALYHVDGFYMKEFETYGIYDRRVRTAHLGSDNS